jgi:hypothetical protein
MDLFISGLIPGLIFGWVTGGLAVGYYLLPIRKPRQVQPKRTLVSVHVNGELLRVWATPEEAQELRARHAGVKS